MSNTNNIGALSKWQEPTCFEDMGLNHELLHSIHEIGFEVPTRLQRDTLPRLLEGCDVIMEAPLNSGKSTTAFISVLQHIKASNLQCQGLTVTPCFETAFRTLKIVLALGSFSIQCHVCADKAHLLADKIRVSKGSQIVIGTPNCTQEFIQNGVLMTNGNIRMFVLNRVDDVFAEGCRDCFKEIFQSIPRGAQAVLLLSKAFPGLEILKTISQDVQEPNLDDPQTSTWYGHVPKEASWEFETSSRPHPIDGDPWGSVPQSSSTRPIEEQPLEPAIESCPALPVDAKPLESIPLPSPAHPPKKKKEKPLQAISSSLALPVKQEAGGAVPKSSSTCPVKERALESDSWYSPPVRGKLWESVPSSWSIPIQEHPWKSVTASCPSRPVKQNALGTMPKSWPTCAGNGSPLESDSWHSPPAQGKPRKSVSSSWSTSIQEKPSFKQNEIYDNFADMGLKSELLRGIADYGLSGPSTTQQCAIGPILKMQDVIVHTPPRADKTDKAAAYSIPILQKLDVSNKECQALILTPSAERARQVREVILALGALMKVKCFGCGSAARKGSQIITGTPRRVLGTITRAKFKRRSITMFVMDQSDEKFSVKELVRTLNLFQLIPKKPQVVIISCTILKQATSMGSPVPFKILHDPVHVDAKVATSNGTPAQIGVNREVTSKSAPVHNVAKGRLSLEDFRQFWVAVKDEEGKLAALNSLCKMIPDTRMVIFYHNREKVGWLKEKLIANNLTTSAIHGYIPQGQREPIIKAFCSGSFRILISTDLLLQDADIGYVPLVVNYDLPAMKENYHHRIGLVDGFGDKGVAINLVTKEEMPQLKEIEKFYSIQIPRCL
ncbi:MAG: P-loop containing nucleoside triphosphate hydrolase protein [Benniella sp.]|nr:MAG: P-loop containing nucleoside triphosphate hydrolase protein [Benniella sp.]